MPTITADEILRKHGICAPGNPGRHYAVCPQCSAQRKSTHRKRKVLGISIDNDGVSWGCNHCNWTGSETFENGRGGEPLTTYDYTDENGTVLYQKVRTSEKKFWQRRPDGNGWINNTKGVRKVLFRLPELRKDLALGHTIFIPEGEKDVDNLRAVGVPATCNPDGAPKPGQKPKWRTEFSEALRGADLVVIPDHDEAGYAHADAIVQMSAGIAKSIRVLKLAEHWPDCPKGGDISDWLSAGHSVEQLNEIVAKLPEWSPGNDTGNDDSSLDIVDAGDDPGPIPPREWLLANQFCRRFISSIVAAGGGGKSALRLVQFISLATGRPLCGQHVFRRCRVLLISFEDDRNELNRRIKAVLDHYQIDRSELKGWLFFTTPRHTKLAELKNRTRVVGPLDQQIRTAIARYKPDLISLDPFIKSHGLEENAVGDMDFVCDLLASVAIEFNVAVDSPHHVHKGQIAPGDADSGRGSSGIRDAGRLVYTLVPMSAEEAATFNLNQDDRKFYIRLDSAKVNITAPSSAATWFHLVGVPIGNATDEYPNGDTIQVVEPWKPPEAWADLSNEKLNAILDEIEVGVRADDGEPTGQRYSSAPSAGEKRAAYRVVQEATAKSKAQCREIIRTWEKNGLLVTRKYDDPEQRKDRDGLYVDNSKRPGTTVAP